MMHGGNYQSEGARYGKPLNDEDRQPKPMARTDKIVAYCVVGALVIFVLCIGLLARS